MADRELQTVLNSGEITSMYIGGVSSDKKVVIKDDIEPSILALGAAGELTPQALSNGVAEKLTWYDSEIATRGTDITHSLPVQEINILTSGIYRIMGTITFEYASGVSVEFSLYKNGTPSGFSNTATGEGSNDPVSVPYIGVSSLSAGDVLSIYVTASSSNSITVNRSSVVIEKIA